MLTKWMKGWQSFPVALKQYFIITANYWAFTLTDGALRMLVVLYFYQLNYQPLEIAALFVFYELFGVVTNLLGGWLGARIGLNKTMNMGLILQVAALLMLATPSAMLPVFWVVFAQALSGIAKDLNKMSAKTSLKYLVKKDEQHQTNLFRWVALLTGSKNTLKGCGFFLGGLLLSLVGFQQAMLIMALCLFFVVALSYLFLKSDIGVAKSKPKFKDILSKNPALNYLSAARLFLFAARDVWFVIALPVFFMNVLHWSHHNVGAFMACWVIGYGIIQAKTPKIFPTLKQQASGFLLSHLALLLAFVTFVIALAILNNIAVEWVLVSGLLLFGAIFAINSSVHSYVIVAVAKEDGASTDVGFYYMANALGRLIGTILSGFIYQQYGLGSCLMLSAFLALTSAYFIRKI